MSTIIVYASKYGCTEKCAGLLFEKVNGKVDIVDLKKEKNVDITKYEKVIIGGSIYVGKVKKEVSEFCKRNINILQEKKIGLFVCGMFLEKAEEELKNAFPEKLLEKAVAKEFFGGEFNFKKMNPMDRLIVKKVAKVDKDTSNIFAEKIDNFADAINNV